MAAPRDLVTLLVLLELAGACHPSCQQRGAEAGPGATVGGTVGGGGLDAHDAQVIPLSLGFWEVPAVLISDADDLCADAQANVLRKASKTLELMLLSESPASGAPRLLAGTYRVDPNEGLFCLGGGDCSFQASASWVSLGDACGLRDARAADGGSVRIDEVDATHVTGAFHLQLGSDVLEGSFDAGRCTPGESPSATSCE